MLLRFYHCLFKYLYFSITSRSKFQFTHKIGAICTKSELFNVTNIKFPNILLIFKTSTYMVTMIVTLDYNYGIRQHYCNKCVDKFT